VNLDPSIEFALEGGSDEKPTHVESFRLTFNQHMDPLHTSIWDIPLSLLRPIDAISIKSVNLLSSPKFYGEGHVYAFMNLKQFGITR
jgi:hypothetical protein